MMKLGLLILLVVLGHDQSMVNCTRKNKPVIVSLDARWPSTPFLLETRYMSIMWNIDCENVEVETSWFGTLTCIASQCFQF